MAAWNPVAASADGTRLVAGGALNGGFIYSSTNSGVTWISNDLPKLSWPFVASSADGDKLFAVANGGGIWTFQRRPNPRLIVVLPGGAPKLSWMVPSTNFAPNKVPIC